MRYEIHPDVENVDLAEIADYIAQDNARAADQVIGAITETFDLLARHPQLGSDYSPLRSSLKSIRMMVVTEYPNYLVYFRSLPRDAGVRILYVLHAARDAASFAKKHRRQ